MAQCLGLAGGLTAFLCLCCVFCAPIDAIARTVMVCFGPFAAASWLMIGIGMSINFYTQSAFLYLMMGTTRAGIFGGAAAGKSPLLCGGGAGCDGGTRCDGDVDRGNVCRASGILRSAVFWRVI